MDRILDLVSQVAHMVSDAIGRVAERIADKTTLTQQVLDKINWRGRFPQPYTYVFPRKVIAAGGSDTSIVTILADAPFLIVGINFHAALGAMTLGNYTFVPARIMLNDTGTGANLFSAPVPLATFAVNSDRGYCELPCPYFMSRSSTLVATLYNDDSSDSLTLDVSLVGVKLLPVTLGAEVIKDR